MRTEWRTQTLQVTAGCSATGARLDSPPHGEYFQSDLYVDPRPVVPALSAPTETDLGDGSSVLLGAVSRRGEAALAAF